jgi:hypothetical protein
MVTAIGASRHANRLGCRFIGVDQTSSPHRQNDVIDPDVWFGRALQGIFVELAFSGLASMYPVEVCAELHSIANDDTGERIDRRN